MIQKFCELNGCFGQLQDRLRNYATLKARLDSKGEEVRQEITRRLEEEGELLRAREKQLLRQVDVATAHFVSVYLVHHAHLHQLVGVAQNFLARNGEQAADPGAEQEAKDLVDRIRAGLKFCDLLNDGCADANGLGISVAFASESIKALERQIMDFGEVSGGSSFRLAPFNGNDGRDGGFGFLPYGHEDYLDSDVGILQSKPLLGSPSVVRVPKRFSATPQQVIGFPVEEKNRWLLQNYEKNSAPLSNRKPQKVDCPLRMTMKGCRKESESSCAESIEVLGNIEDEAGCHCQRSPRASIGDQSWSEDDEFMLLKKFCKKDPVCPNLKDCRETTSEHCVKLALEKPSSANVSAVNINNRSMSRSTNWLLKKHNAPQQVLDDVRGSSASFESSPWLADVGNQLEWKKTVAKHWEKIWKTDNETWLIRRKRHEIASAAPPQSNVEEKVATEKEEIAAVLPKKSNLDYNPSVNSRQWIITKNEQPIAAPIETKEPAAVTPEGKKDTKENIWRLPTSSSKEVDVGDEFYAKLNSLRRDKASAYDWVIASKSSPKQSKQPTSGDYKAWLAPSFRRDSVFGKMFVSH